MIKIVGLVASCGLLVALAGCDSASDNPPVKDVAKQSTNRFNGIHANEIDIITDSQTGCKYIYVDKGVGNYETTAMSPLMRSNGLADCPHNSGASY